MMNAAIVPRLARPVRLTAARLRRTFRPARSPWSIPFAAGGPTDVLGRIVAQRMGEILGQQVVIENVGGAGGMTGSKRVADAAPDGYSIVHRHGRHPRPGPDALQEAALQLADRLHPGRRCIAQVPIVLIARKDLPAKDFKEFVAYAQGQPGQDAVRLGRRRLGHASRLRAAQLHHRLNITHMPYRGTGPAMQDLPAGRIDYLCEIVTTAKPQIDGGTVKAHRDPRQQALAGAAGPADRGRAGHQGPRCLHLERALPAEEHAGRRSSKKLNEARGRGDATRRRSRTSSSGSRRRDRRRTTRRRRPTLGKFVKDETEKWAVPIKASGVIGRVTSVDRFDECKRAVAIAAARSRFRINQTTKWRRAAGAARPSSTIGEAGRACGGVRHVARKKLFDRRACCLLFRRCRRRRSRRVVESKLNLRSGPGPAFAIVAVMPPGTKLDTQKCNDEWCRVKFGRQVGYASRKSAQNRRGFLCLRRAGRRARGNEAHADRSARSGNGGRQRWRNDHWRRLDWHNRMGR